MKNKFKNTVGQDRVNLFSTAQEWPVPFWFKKKQPKKPGATVQNPKECKQAGQTLAGGGKTHLSGNIQTDLIIDRFGLKVDRFILFLNF